jgi:regulator of chromosome condensation
MQIIQVAAGGMHTVVLSEDGRVFTFGVNDDMALGRITTEEEEQFDPKEVDLTPNKIVQISAGDSHSVALTDDGRVFFWGTVKVFRK